MPSHPRFVVGDRVPGTKWVVCEVLGEGGMGIVFGVVKEPGIRGAMKVMHPQFAGRPSWVERFFEEVRLMATLQHPNIVQVFDYDKLDDGTPYVVMEWLKGKTLRQAQRVRKKSFPAIMAYEITRQLCEGLYRAHSHAPSVIHRDIKPANIFLHRQPFGEPVVKLVDFGVATLSDGKRDRGLYGTPLYMAPEQLRGERVTPKTDLYAAALLLYEMLTGRLPWNLSGATTQRIVTAHLEEVPASPREFVPWLPVAVEAHILSALAKDPEKRPRDAYAFIGKLFELQWVNDGSPRTADVNTTAPMLSTLIEDEMEPPTESNEGNANSTFRGMSPPPIDGCSLELVDPKPRDGDRFLQATAAPTSIPVFPPSVDRNAQTLERRVDTPPYPRSGTEPVAPTRIVLPAPIPTPAPSVAEITQGSDAGTTLSVRAPDEGPLSITIGRRTLRRTGALVGATLILSAGIVLGRQWSSVPRPTSSMGAEVAAVRAEIRKEATSIPPREVTRKENTPSGVGPDASAPSGNQEVDTSSAHAEPANVRPRVPAKKKPVVDRSELMENFR